MNKKLSIVLILFSLILSKHLQPQKQETIQNYFNNFAGSWITYGTALNDYVWAIDASGSLVYVGGAFTDAGGISNADRIAMWNGSNWNALGTGLNATVGTIAISGTNVYVGGWFTDAGGNPNADYIAFWNVSSWQSLGTGLNNTVEEIAVNGSDVYVGGRFTDAGGNPNGDYVAKWNGSSWESLGSGLNGWCTAIAISGTDIYVGGTFTNAGGIPEADYIAKWNGTSWEALDSGLNAIVDAIAISGSDIYVGGNFTNAGGIPEADYIAKWNGTSWEALDSGLNNYVYHIESSYSNIYVGGRFTNAGGIPEADYIAKWNGTSWEALGTGVNNRVQRVSISGEFVYCGGWFTTAGGITSQYFACWQEIAHDVASINFLSPPDTVFSSEQNIIGVVGNVGTYNESFNVHCIVTDQLDAILFDTLVNITLNVGEFDTLQFGSLYLQEGIYTLMMATLLSGDQNPANDTFIKQTFCYDTAKITTFDFETGWQGWTHTSSSVFPMAWDVKESNLHSSYMSPNPGDSSLWIDSDASGQVDIRDTAISPVFTDVVGGWLIWGVGYQYESGDTFKVLYRIFNDTTWSSWIEQIHYTSNKKSYWDSLNTAVLNFDSMQIAFMYFGNYDWYASIDNIGQVILPQVNQVEETPVLFQDNFSIKFTTSNIISNKLSFNLLLPFDSDVKFVVYDIAGRIISNVVYSKLNAGNHNIIWQTNDSEGNSLSNGVYFYQIEASENFINGKFVIVE